MTATLSPKRALISVSDKTGIVELAHALHNNKVEILSTGGTASLLQQNAIPVTEVSEYTQFPEMMSGRVKTLHPKVHGGILGRRGIDDALMQEHQIAPIDIVIINLYPFQQATADPNCTLATAIENIDIGGPAMVRSAAKNHQDVAIVVNPKNYPALIHDLNQGCINAKTRFELALEAFEHTAQYDGAIANYLGRIESGNNKTQYPNTFNTQFIQKNTLRYGENPHQSAAFYTEHKAPAGCISSTKQIQGKALSYNNIADTDAALECVKQFQNDHACVIVKHANPCGVAVADTQLQAYKKAFSTDTESAFGGIIAFNQELDAETASAILENQFVEVIIAPTVSEAAQEVCKNKENVRVLACGQWNEDSHNLFDFKRVTGGLLVQEADMALFDTLQVVSKKQPSEQQMQDLLFAWNVAKFVKSNAIVYANQQMTIGVGAGQMSRVNSARIAAIKAEHAGLPVKGAVMASDAFFPFRDGIDNAANVGIQAVIQPGGSIRDQEIIAAADEHDMTMVFTNMRHFRH